VAQAYAILADTEVVVASVVGFPLGGMDSDAKRYETELAVDLGGLDGGQPTRLAPDLTSGVYAPQGWLLWARGNALTAQRLDLERPALTGELLTLADGVAVDGTSLRSALSVSATGLVAYRTAEGAARQLRWFDRAGTARGAFGEPNATLSKPALSPDGRRLAVTRMAQRNSDLWLLDGTRASRFTFDPSQELYPLWSPDGTRIVYTSRSTGIGALFHKLTSGAGIEEQLLATDQTLAPTSWSADGRFLLYISIDPQTNADLWVLPMSGDAATRKPFVFLKTPFREAYGAFSPDGRWVAYHSSESGRPEVYLRPFTPPSGDGPAGPAAMAGSQWQVSTDGGILPVWRADGKELYYLNPAGAMMAATITASGSSLQPGAPVMLFPTRIFGGGADIQFGRQYDVSEDGRFLINSMLNEAAAPITLLQNWQPDAK
jgi:Tol biopolymer transport system component